MIQTRKKIIIGIIILIAVLLIIKGIIAYIPLFMMGVPFEVFGINNMDYANHNINVQVFDSTNKLILNETYDLGPSQTFFYPETGWKDVQDKDRVFPNGNYTFIITLDGNVIETYQEVMDTWSSAHIEIDNNGKMHIGKIAG
ncbi:MAG: hypothetical protein OIN87_06870 [Candidatus Methanoperedens sp.]|nr:hypothetical protein [Candidatus Methanoperedens sp.]